MNNNNDQHQQPDQAHRQSSVEATLAYLPDLMPEYLDTHQELLRLFMAIANTATAGDFYAVPEALNVFKTRLDNHLLSEAVHFYGYLEQQLASEPEKVRLVDDFRREVRGIARQVTHFIREWLETPLTADNMPLFLEQHRQVGEVLVRRIQMEESDLYPLYQPSA